MNIFSRWFHRRSTQATTRRGKDPATRDEMHRCFKTAAGRGPFLLSYDGRVIPLRKARFLQDR
ncbi:MAG TPA: hypothetical protein ENK48_03605 [Gammaproteobacteria bacterium]|nr:hypothetical protein [Gammaproteobacteria bacterium]